MTSITTSRSSSLAKEIIVVESVPSGRTDKIVGATELAQVRIHAPQADAKIIANRFNNIEKTVHLSPSVEGKLFCKGPRDDYTHVDTNNLYFGLIDLYIQVPTEAIGVTGARNPKETLQYLAMVRAANDHLKMETFNLTRSLVAKVAFANDTEEADRFLKLD